MKISQLQQIVEIISCGSINKAAQKLYISQSGLCASLNAAEKELGQKILHRSYNGITLTPFGLQFVDSAKEILQIYDRLLLAALPEERDRLCVSSDFLLYASSAFTMVCNENGGKYTEYRFTENNNDAVLQDVLSGTSDLGIISTPTAARERVFAVFEKLELDGNVICTNASSCLVGPHSPLYELEGESIPLEHLDISLDDVHFAGIGVGNGVIILRGFIAQLRIIQIIHPVPQILQTAGRRRGHFIRIQRLRHQTGLIFHILALLGIVPKRPILFLTAGPELLKQPLVFGQLLCHAAAHQGGQTAQRQNQCQPFFHRKHSFSIELLLL